MRLDARQRAMLREMGIRVWWRPASPPENPSPASTRPVAERAPGSPRSADPPAAAQTEPQDRPAGWRVGPPQALHGDNTAGPRWLLLAEQREHPGGQAQALLQAMLKAAGLHRAGSVWLAPMQKQAAPAAMVGLEESLSKSEPDVVFIMGRLAAQALLESTEPLGQLRGQVHDLWGLPAVVSYDCAALLRHPADKVKAWDDLCLALQVAREHSQARLESDPAD